MKLTKKIETEITQFLQNYWDTYFEGNLSQWQSFLTEDYKNIGTNQEEIWNNKREILDYTNKVLDQMVGKAVVRNKTVQIIPYDPYIMTHELGDLYIKNGRKWTFYAPIRLSSLIQKKETGWIVLHQHGSFPDSKTQKGEAFAVDALKNENLKLQNAVKKRTLELEQKNRELEVETALEKVRSRTMAMQHSDELQEASFLLDQQVRALGIKTWGCAFNIYGEKESTEWFGNEKGVLPTYSVPRKGIFKEYYQKGQKGESFYIKEFSGKTCVDHYEYMSSLPVIGDVLKNLKKTNKGFPTYQIDHIAYFKYGYLLFITKEHVPEAHDIFKRFAKVFEQTYTRFLDLQKAEAQAKEAQIEAALERVRSRSMAMHKSEELLEAGSLLYSELSKLGIKHLSTGYILFDDKAEIGYSYGVNPADGSIRQQPVGMIHNQTKTMKAIVSSWKKQEPLLVIELNEKETIKHQTFIAEKSTNFPLTAAQLLAISPKRLVIHCFNFKQGYLLIVGGTRLIDEQQEMVVRFAKVFQQTYTRFLDLQKAETQAKEAQIETALERVRSRSMAMHNSNELQDVIHVVHKELLDLNLSINGGSFIAINDDIGTEIRCWGSGGTANTSEEILIPRYEKPFYTNLLKGIKKGVGFFTESYTQEEKKAFFKHLFNYEPWANLSEKKKNDTLKSSGGYARSCCVTKHTSIFIINHYGKQFTEAENNILKRFSNVFEQTYTRFLDLQKAETQARESQIETALEKVRSRSMAMHKSEEIGDVAFVLFEQLKSLGGELWGTGFGFCKNASDTDEFWFANEKGIMPYLKIPNNVDEAHKKMYQGWKEKLELFSIEKGGKELKDHYKYMLTVPDVQPIFQGMLDNGVKFPNWQKWHAAYFKYGYMLVITTEPYQNETIFIRFAKVFEQAYTRFLDLKKAEAQARESQIQLALERVRTQSMLMQHSDELDATSKVFHEQLRLLRIDTEFSYVWLPDEAKNEHQFWVAWNSEQNKKDINSKAIIYPLDKTEPYTAACFKDWSSGNTVHIHHIKPKEIKTFFSAWEELLKDAKNLTPKYFSNGLYYAEAFMKYGCFGINIKRSITEEEKQILQRFSIEFERTYTRFLDLQKAEAQARESQIETALEKVRSRSMAMHNSEELKEVIQVLYDQFIHLNIKIEHAGFILDYKENDDMHIWLADHNAVFPKIVLPYFDCAHWNSFIEAKKTGKNFFANTLGFEEKNKFYKDLFQFIPDLPEDTKKTYLAFKGLAISTVLLDNVGLYIENYSGTPFSEEDNKILIRFGTVFQQSYTRFLDLQRAEVQAKEAQIETALERVRSQSMGMQTSKDLSRVTTEMFNQLRQFGGDLFATGIVFCDKHEGHVEQWHSLPDAGMMSPFIVPIDLDYIHQYRYDEWKKGTELFSVEIPSDFIKQHFQDIFNLPSAQKVLKDFEDQNTPMPEAPPWEIDYGASFKHGYLLVSSLQPFEEAEILPRFAKVFEQTYTRFLDLKKAEAQTREAQINLAVERVRAKALAMHKSEEIIDVVAKLKDEVMSLDIPDVIAATIFLKEGDDKVRMWDLSSLEKLDGVYQSPLDITFKLKKTDPHLYPKRVWENPDNYFVIIQDTKGFKRIIAWLREHNKHEVANETEAFIEASQLKQLYHAAKKLNNGKLVIDLLDPPSDEMETILTKMGAAFDLAYKRFEDLQKAEAQAREAQIETALEKVRSRTMAMQHSDELPEAANNLFLQVQALGIPAWSAGYCIWEDESKKSAWCNMSSEGEIQKGFSLPSIGEGYDFYKPFKNKESFHVAELGGKALVKHYDFMKKLPIVGEVLKEFGEKGIALPTFQIFHIVYFTHGYLMFITYEAVPDAHQIFKRFGQVFEQTYTRFLDLKKAEAQSDLIKKEKERLEVTLSELKATQSQLIQSEKMASLGELTAGIAHEIQNPLNFVNNFSEVSKELLDEMLEEIENGDMEEVKAIMDDVIQNLEKINHHGKRADGIVKGMLQHSRASGDKKEPTNINALADEYLRLAYHGLRAKDKSFNATLETDYDDTLEKINIIPQDIGRVVLNLLTNAFYACTERSRSIVNEKKQSNQNGFEPTVKLSTKKNGNWVTISVKDNGNGIPQKVFDKIFQPFFTTKPTGQGTGLGLSMSYDIITKGHGGELKVNTEQNKGTEFIIKLPIKDK